MSGAFGPGQRLEGLGIKPGTDVQFAIPDFGFGGRIFMSQKGDRDGLQVPIAGYGSPVSTGELKHNASALEVQQELEELSPIGSGNVEVSGGPGALGAPTPYTIEFKGDLKNTNVGLLEVGSGALEGNAVAKATTPGGLGTAVLVLMAQNIGGAASSGTITLRATLPSGITMLGKVTAAKGGEGWSCETSTAIEIVCTRNEAVRPGLTIPQVNATIAAAPEATGGTVEIEVSSDGGAASATEELPLEVSATPAEPGFQFFAAGAYDENGAFDQQAGGHPFSASTAMFVNTVRSPKGFVVPAGEPKDIVVKLPPGFLGNPSAVPACPESTPAQACDIDSMLGVVEVLAERFDQWSFPASVLNTQAPIGYPGKFRFRIFESEEVNVVGQLRSDEDYGIDAASLNTPQVDQVLGVFFTFWGAPSSSAFDSLRCKGPEPGLANVNAIRLETGCQPSAAPNTAFLTSAVNCTEQAAKQPAVSISTTIWQLPGQFFETAFDIPPVTDCENLTFDGGFSFQPSGSTADSPASFTTSLTMPDEGLTDPTKLITPELKDSIVTLPEGVVLNASGADGLEACSLDQIGYKGKSFPMPNPIRFDKAPNECPDASKIGTLELKSALIDETLKGALYLAAQGDGNPFGSLFAIYLVIEDPRHGIFIKLPGRVDPDAQDGQMKVSFNNLPQLPFTSLDLNLKGGDRSALASPATCGKYTTTATNTPWSAPESKTPGSDNPVLTMPSSFDVNAGPNGLPCANTPGERPFGLGLSAGADSTQAGAASTLRFQLTRPDGHQEIDTLRFDLPAGLAASLRGIPYCSDAAIASAAGRDSGKAEQSSPSCPAASRVGRTLAGAGSGPRPFYAPGELYLAGPYRGSPLSVVAITPAVAGPFDLGNVVIRNAISVDPVTAQVSAISDPVPQIVEGVPLRVRDIRVILDRPGFGLNPTDCSEKQIGATVTGNSGATANLATRFQVGNCGALGFKPKTRLQLFGGIRRGKYQGVRAVVRPRPGDANISRTVVRFPRSAFVAQEHIRTVCTRVQFAADACPKGSIYGRAIAYSPLVDYPLRGNVYLRSSDNDLPDAVADLRGPAHQPIRVEVAVRNDSVKGALRNTVQAVPDAPVSYFRLQIFGGKKGLIVNSRNICRGRNQARVAMAA
ncbi:MAG TPA: hypothetical protein VFC52_06535, partial [Solirubrobacterales bacterium]|nr:hypothetical protein [Solirubrobacterales bacterium]